MREDRLAATRASYDAVAHDYAELLRDHLDGQPTDRGVLARFAGSIVAEGGGLVGDLGCGPGRLFGALGSLGLEVVGVDLSPAMVAVARDEHPAVAATVGSLDRLPLPTGALAGALLWYSTIHTPDDDLPAVFAEVRRAVRPGGLVVAAFQVGDEVRHHRHLYGHDLDLRSHRRSPDAVADSARVGGWVEDDRIVRGPAGGEDGEQAYLFLRSTR